MIYYDDSKRGLILDRARGKQIIDFSGIRYGKITPTDIDGFIEYHDRIRIFLEYKVEGEPIPNGQRLAFERVVKDEEKLGKRAALLIVRHKTPPEKDIDGANSKVEKFYTAGQWLSGEGKTAKALIDEFIFEG